MRYKESIEFKKDKNRFFQVITDDNLYNPTIDYPKKYSLRHNYNFIATNRIFLEQEINQLFAALKKVKLSEMVNQQSNTIPKELWLYSYYCCSLLKQYHSVYGQHSKVAEYQQLMQDIRSYQSNQLPVKYKNKQSFFNAICEKIVRFLKYILTLPRHLSRLKEVVGFSNLNRLYWVFCRLALVNSLRLVKDLQFLDKIEAVLNKKIDVEAFIKTFDRPNDVLRVFSVALFVIRIMMNLALLLKHTFFPAQQEKLLPRKERFLQEIYKRHPEFLNDLVWGMVNTLTNYPQVFHLANSLSPWVTVSFVFFDFALLLWRRHLAQHDYLAKKSQYHGELKYYSAKLIEDITKTERLNYTVHVSILHEQLAELEITWQVKSSTLWFDASAALLLIAGFSASMLLTSPVWILISYTACMFAVAMYLSESAYAQYQDKGLRLQQSEVNQEDSEKALSGYQLARNNFIETLLFNAFMPTLLLTTFAISWPAALVLAALYIGKEVWQAYEIHQQEQIDSLPMLTGP